MTFDDQVKSAAESAVRTLNPDENPRYGVMLFVFDLNHGPRQTFYCGNISLANTKQVCEELAGRFKETIS